MKWLDSIDQFYLQLNINIKLFNLLPSRWRVSIQDLALWQINVINKYQYLLLCGQWWLVSPTSYRLEPTKCVLEIFSYPDELGQARNFDKKLKNISP